MKKKLTLTVLFILILTTILSTGVYAGYQSIPTTATTSVNTADKWIISIRQMEELGEGLGLSETIDTATGESTSGSNKIDVHMMKNTEYGATILLATSDYGKQPFGSNTWAGTYLNNGSIIPSTLDAEQASTTGNFSGIYDIAYYYQWVAGGGDEFLEDTLPDLAERYINRYTLDESSARVGDATIETKGWKGASYTWINDITYGFSRNAPGFTFNGQNTTNCISRSVVVNGEGI